MPELSKTKLNYIFITLSLVSFALLRWSIAGLNPENNAIKLGSLQLGQDASCLNINEKPVSLVEINHSSGDFFSITGRGSLMLGAESSNNFFTGFATFDPIGKLFGAKLVIDIDGRIFELQLKGAENTEVTVTIKNLADEPIIKVFHVEGPLLFVDIEKLKKEKRAEFSVLSANIILKGESLINLRKQIKEKIGFSKVDSEKDCRLKPLLDKEKMAKFNENFDRFSKGELAVFEEIFDNLGQTFKFY